MSAEEHGRWELDLWSGSAWFSDWFRRRLHWPAEGSRKKLDALRPYLAPGAWEALLQGIRAHLERQVPLEVEIQVLVDGQTERWQVTGAVERTPAGQPVCLTGTMHDVDGRDVPGGPRPEPSESSDDAAP